MRYISSIGLALAAIFAADAAYAQTPLVAGYDWTYYGSAGYSYLHASVAGFSADLGAITGRLGVRYQKFVGAEAEGSVGVVDQKIGSGSLKLNNQFAGYVVGYIPLSGSADILARVGYGRAEVGASGPGGSASASGNTWNIGVGGQYRFDQNDGIRLDYTRYNSTDSTSAKSDTVTVSYVRTFY